MEIQFPLRFAAKESIFPFLVKQKGAYQCPIFLELQAGSLFVLDVGSESSSNRLPELCNFRCKQECHGSSLRDKKGSRN